MKVVFRSKASAVLGVALLAGSVFSSANVQAGRADPDGLPGCPAAWSASDVPEACVLSVRNGGFEDGVIAPWDALGSKTRVGLAAADGTQVAVLEDKGGAVVQVIDLPANAGYVGGREATYALRFRLRANGPKPVTVGYRLVLSDHDGRELGQVVSGSINAGFEWEILESIVSKRDLPEGARVTIELTRDDADGAYSLAYVDDVSLLVRERR